MASLGMREAIAAISGKLSFFVYTDANLEHAISKFKRFITIKKKYTIC